MDRAIGVINWRSIFRATSCPACVKLWLAVAQIIAVPSKGCGGIGETGCQLHRAAVVLEGIW